MEEGQAIETASLAAAEPAQRAVYSDGLPMPHKANGRRVSAAERLQYARRRQAHYDRDPDYPKRFNRLPIQIFNKAWKLVASWLPEKVQIVKGKKRELVPPGLTSQEKFAYVVLVDLFINAARSGRGVTYNEMFDEVCRKYSDHFVASQASRSRDMLPRTVKNARRDLLCNYIDINKLWAVFRSLRMPGEPLLSVSQDATSDPSTPLRVRPIHDSEVKEFVELAAETPWFFSSRNRGIRLLVRDDDDDAERAASGEIAEAEEFCAEVGYNRAQPGVRSLRSMELQARSTLLFDVDTFKADFLKMEQLMERLRRDIVREYKFDPGMSTHKIRLWQKQGRNKQWVKSEIWSERERFIYYNSIVEGFKQPLYGKQVTRFYRRKLRAIREEESATRRRRKELNLKYRYEQFVVWLVDHCAMCLDHQEDDAEAREARMSWQQSLSDLVRSRRAAVKQEYARRWKEYKKLPVVQDILSAEEAGMDKAPSKREAAKKKRLADFETGRALLNRLRKLRERGAGPKGLDPKVIIRAGVAGWSWRQSVRAKVAEYDKAREFCRLYRAAYVQLKEDSGRVPIRSRFFLSINRRYQPRHMWPTYVGDWSTPGDETGERVYRRRWFKAPHPRRSDTACRLVGYDVSSSQTQIIAVLLGIERLERLAMRAAPGQRPFKETLAAWAFRKHRDKKDKFKLRSVRAGVKGSKRYTGPQDSRLQELCKSLWMKISYGSSVSEIVPEQDADPATFGPGWTWDNAQRFLDYVQGRFKDVKLFLDACKKIGANAFERDPTEGVVFTDPSDGLEVRWNPVAREDQRVKSDSHTLIVSLPAGMKVGDFEKRSEEDLEAVPDEALDADAGVRYPVDRDELSKMIAPCLIHMLDAHYSTLVMEKLAARGIKDFVAIHDCWLVPEWLEIDGTLSEGSAVLRKVLDEVNKEWYTGLGPVYERMLHYLGGDRVFRERIEKARQLWKKRSAAGYAPPFLAKPGA
ncbi:MAG: hypothetical protein WB764_10165 [Xanthobacteraceae bacterium]